MAPGIEFSDLNWVALLIGMASNVVLGFLWYAAKGPTGRIWMREMKLPADLKPSPKQMMTSLVLMVVGTFLLLFVLMHVFLAFRDAYRLDGARLGDGLEMGDGFQGAIFTWLGFFVPIGLSTVAWEGKSWTLFFVNQGYYLVSLLVVGSIFAAMM